MDRRKGTIHEVSEAELKKALEPTEDERRADPRVAAKLEVDVPLATWDQVRTVYTTNISKGGLLFTLAGPASVAAQVELTLALPDGSKVTLQSEVRHVARREGTPEFDVGVQFSELEPKTRAAFETALARIGKP
jgi:c-di-GMP-binding flagellar brake protein YcgR